MEEARQHSFVDSGWFNQLLYASHLAGLALAPLLLASLLFGDLLFYVGIVFLAVAFANLLLWLIWGWHKREFWAWGARICSQETSPIGFWATMVFGAVAAAIALAGIYFSILIL